MDPVATAPLPPDGRAGDRRAFDPLFEQVYEELGRITQQHLQRRRRGETLSTTALVHEVYRQLIDQNGADAADRAYFLALASRAMRLILVDYARARLAGKRGGAGEGRLDAVQVAADERAADVVALHEALEVLAQRNEWLGRMIEYRFFGGASYEEIADVIGCPVPTVKRDWRRARAWLYRAMQATDA